MAYYYSIVAKKVVTPKGWYFGDDTTGNTTGGAVILPPGSSGTTGLYFTANGGIFLGGGNNWGVGANGVPNVSAAIKTGGVGYPTIMGLSPNSTVGSVAPGTYNGYLPFSTTTLTGATTAQMAAFLPQGGGISWYRVSGYINAHSVSTATNTLTMQTTFVDEDGTLQTLNAAIVRNSNGVSGSGITLAGQYHFQEVYPHTYTASTLSTLYGQAISAALVSSGTAGATAVVSGLVIIEKLGNAS